MTRDQDRAQRSTDQHHVVSLRARQFRQIFGMSRDIKTRSVHSGLIDGRRHDGVDLPVHRQLHGQIDRMDRERRERIMRAAIAYLFRERVWKEEADAVKTEPDAVFPGQRAVQRFRSDDNNGAGGTFLEGRERLQSDFGSDAGGIAQRDGQARFTGPRYRHSS